MSIHLHMLPPSVNNLTARVFMRASGLDFEESNAWGQTRSPEFMAKVPSHLTPAIEDGDHPRGAMWESCAVMMYLANKHGLDHLYPSDPGRRALVDNANFYLTGTLYPLVARSTYPRPHACPNPSPRWFARRLASGHRGHEHRGNAEP